MADVIFLCLKNTPMIHLHAPRCAIRILRTTETSEMSETSTRAPPVTGDLWVCRARRGAPAVAGGAQARLREEARLLEIVLVMARTRAAAQSEARVISPPATAPNRPAS